MHYKLWIYIRYRFITSYNQWTKIIDYYRFSC